MKNVWLLLILLCSLNINSQNSGFLLGTGVDNMTSSQVSLYGSYFNNFNNSKVQSKVEGTPYLFDTWLNKAKIQTIDNKKYILNNFNFNTKTGFFESMLSKDTIFVFKPTALTEVDINGKVFRKFLNSKTNTFAYYEVLSEIGDKQLVKKYLSNIRVGSINRLTMQKQPDYYVLKTKYFLKDSDGFREVSLTKKNILKLIGDKESKQVDEYIRKNKLSFKKEDDVLKLINYYNSL